MFKLIKYTDEFKKHMSKKYIYDLKKRESLLFYAIIYGANDTYDYLVKEYPEILEYAFHQNFVNYTKAITDFYPNRADAHSYSCGRYVIFSNIKFLRDLFVKYPEIITCGKYKLLEYAIRKGNLDMIEFLINAKCPITDDVIFEIYIAYDETLSLIKKLLGSDKVQELISKRV